MSDDGLGGGVSGGLVRFGALLVAGSAVADDQCAWNGGLYGPGSITCQAGAQARCTDGRWQRTGLQCADEAGDPPGKENEPAVGEPAVVQPPVE